MAKLDNRNPEKVLQDIRKKRAGYIREYRRKHPEKAMQSRLSTAANLLERHGYTVITPAEVNEA